MRRPCWGKLSVALEIDRIAVRIGVVQQQIAELSITMHRENIVYCHGWRTRSVITQQDYVNGFVALRFARLHKVQFTLNATRRAE